MPLGQSATPGTARRVPHREAADRPGSLAAAVEREPNPLRRYLKILGPGFISGASDDDPAGIGTCVVAGARLGYATLWTALLTLPLMATVQYICAKVGVVSGRGLAGVLRHHYPRWLLYPAVLALPVANNPRIMGERTKGLGTNGLGWAATLAMLAAAIVLVVTWRAS